MAKQKNNGIPFDPLTGKILHEGVLPQIYCHTTDKWTVQPQYIGLNIIWKPYGPFHMELTLTSICRTTGSCCACLKDANGIEYIMYENEFNDAIKYFTGAVLSCNVVFIRKGGHYCLKAV